MSRDFKTAAQQVYYRLFRTLVREEGNFAFNFDSVHGGIESGLSLAGITRTTGKQGCPHLVLRTWLPPSSPGYLDIWQRRNCGRPHLEYLKAENRIERFDSHPLRFSGVEKGNVLVLRPILLEVAISPKCLNGQPKSAASP